MMEADTLVMAFAGLMALAVLVYTLLDGYDLGVGILLPAGPEPDAAAQRDTMIASIGPFWDANETWLVLAVGLLLIAFPSAYNLVLRELYLPATLMLAGLILRGVSFDFRAKVNPSRKRLWDYLFQFGSGLAAFMQGYMLGHYVVGLDSSPLNEAFAVLSGCCVMAAYGYIGGAWLVMKTEGALQRRAATWARKCGVLTAVGVLAVCIVNPLVNPGVYDRWFALPGAILVLQIPVLSLLLFVINHQALGRIPFPEDHSCWLPFACAAGIFFLCFQALAYSFFPYAIPGRMTFMQAASAPESLRFILVGAITVVPVILAYTAYSYRVFWGKARDLNYY